MGSINEVLSHKLLRLFADLWLLISTYLFPLVTFTTTYFFRLKRKGSSLKHNTSCLYDQNHKLDSEYVKEDAEVDRWFEEDASGYNMDMESDDLCEKETTDFFLKFKFPTYEEFCRNNADFVSSKAGPSASISSNDAEAELIKSNGDNADFVSSEAIPSTTSLFSIDDEFVKSSETSVTFVEEMEDPTKEVLTETISCSSRNRGVDGDKEEFLLDNDFRAESFHEEDYLPMNKDFNLLNSEEESVHEETYVNSVVTSVNGDGEEFHEKSESVTFTRSEEETRDEEHNLQFSDEMEFSFSSTSSVKEEECLATEDIRGEVELDHLIDMYGKRVESYDQISDFDKSVESYDQISDFDESVESHDFDGEDSDLMEELGNMEEEHINLNEFKANFLSEKDFRGEESDKFKYVESGGINNNKAVESSDDSEIPDLKSSTFLDEDTTKLEILWEHQDLMEQLKMELKKVRATGLPTILEDSDSPKVMEDLKPWKIDEKLKHDNPMDELHKFHKSYKERMRKFDILNYQKMYAIGFLQLKDTQSFSMKKTLVPEIASILSENMSLYKNMEYETDPTKKFINELLIELEVAYVGQMCLSWEFLHWQYGMALDIWESDSRGVRCYNEVAGEFQQFQVLVQRFVEDEPFQGPRIQNYINHRCVMRSFLQVPVIREDISYNKKNVRRSHGDDYSITSDLLVEIVEESMRILWRFIRADRDTKLKNQKRIHVDLQDHAELETIKELRKDLQKKERKLKDQLRSANCIVKKFQTCGEDENISDQVLFFSRVDMKLVSRVLNMSKPTTDQLDWCRSKLNTISFVNRNIHIEPSFFLFPC